MIHQTRRRAGLWSAAVAALLLSEGCNPSIPIQRAVELEITFAANGLPAAGSEVIVAGNRGTYLSRDFTEQYPDRIATTRGSGGLTSTLYSCDGSTFQNLFDGRVTSTTPPPPSDFYAEIDGPEGQERLRFMPVEGFEVSGEIYRLKVVEIGVLREQDEEDHDCG